MTTFAKVFGIDENTVRKRNTSTRKYWIECVDLNGNKKQFPSFRDAAVATSLPLSQIKAAVHTGVHPPRWTYYFQKIAPPTNVRKKHSMQMSMDRDLVYRYFKHMYALGHTKAAARLELCQAVEKYIKEKVPVFDEDK